MYYKYQVIVSTLVLCGVLCLTAASTQQNTATQRQGVVGPASGGILSTLGSLVPGVVSNLLPMVFLFGLGALMVPALGLGLLLREGRRRSFPSFNINTSAIMEGASDVFEKVMKALDNVDKKYN